MRARARIVAAADLHQSCRLVEVADAAPIGLRWTRDAVYIVGTAQGLVGNDDLTLDVVVRQGATLRLRSAAASMAYTSNGARLTVSCSVEPGGVLDWQPEPLITTRGCDVTLRARIALAAGAGLRWHEEHLLGRFEEHVGDLDLAISVDHDGAPLLRQQLIIGSAAPVWTGPAVVGSYRAIGLGVIAGSCPQPPGGVGDGWAAMQLEGPGTVITAVANTHQELRRRLAAAEFQRGPYRPQ